MEEEDGKNKNNSNHFDNNNINEKNLFDCDDLWSLYNSNYYGKRNMKPSTMEDNESTLFGMSFVNSVRTQSQREGMRSSQKSLILTTQMES